MSRHTPDSLWSCCFQEPATIWGLLLLLATLSAGWSLSGEPGGWSTLSVMLLGTTLLLGLGFRRGRRAEQLGRGRTVFVGGRSLVRAVVTEVSRVDAGGWRLAYVTGEVAREDRYLQKPPESTGDIGEAELGKDGTRFVRPVWRDRFLLDRDLVFDAGPQVRKVWFLIVLSLACAIGATVWGYDLSRTWGLASADGGSLKPLWARLLLGGSLAGAGLAFGLAMIGYGLRYVTMLRRTGTDAFELRTLLGGRRTVARADLGLGPFHEGRGRTIGWIVFFPITAIRVVAPWRSAYVRGAAGPFILDLQGAVSEDFG